MASFGDRTDYTTYHSNREYQTNTNKYQSRTNEYENNKAAEYTVPIKKPYPDTHTPEHKAPEKLTEVKESEVTQSVAGPAVFYPPGSTTFVKKEEVMQQVMIICTIYYCSYPLFPITKYVKCICLRVLQQGQSGQGQMKAKGKGMYKYKSKSKSKEKSSSGATMVPVCLPMCCAMPCVIM